ncbi:hypothetical protein Pfl01_0158 [Pseudomonas fluorescens Pf0-1]|uniref:Uncharacterized protein n=1 Tax=Pseudomonas fluorescens (strain Pf0-1) TaxID=205922 RepID=Q3KK04_PSEPF|nr:hypothetical protein Pfl01_0158 [Pseudomonas fluorescens Pf0-1]
MGDDLHRAHALMLVQVIGDLLQTVLAGIELDHLGAGGHALDQAVGILDPGIDEHHALPRHGYRAGGGRGIGLAMGVLAGARVVGGRCFRGIGGGMAVSLGGGVGDGGRDGAVEQHARFERHDHGRRQRPLAFGNPRLLLAPPHVAHPDSNTVVDASMKNAAIS